MRILCALDNAYFCNLVLDSEDALVHAQEIIRHLQLENEVVYMEANTGWLEKSQDKRYIQSYFVPC